MNLATLCLFRLFCVIINKMKKGFTLLELLIGITIFAIVSGAVYTSLYLGVKVWKHEEENNSGFQEIRLTFGLIEENLRSVFLNPDNENIKFKGSIDRIEFFRVNKSEQLEEVAFYLESQSSKDESTLFILKQKYQQAESDSEAVSEVVNNRISSFKISYFNNKENKWDSEWTEELIVPSQIKVEIAFNFDDAGKSIVLEKYISIPIAHEIDMPISEDEA